MTDQWEVYKAIRRGDGDKVVMHTDKIYSFYGRVKWGKEGRVPVYNYVNNDGHRVFFRGRVAVHDEMERLLLFQRSVKDHVAREDVMYWLEHGQWPGDVESPAGIGDNSGNVSILEELSDYQSQALAWLKEVGKIADQVTSDKAANYAVQLGKLKSKADKERKDLVQPHLDAQRDINGKYNPPIKEADAAVTTLKRAQDAWLLAEKRRLEDEARQKYQQDLAKAEAERKRIEAERAEQMTADPVAAMTEPAPEVAPPPPPPEPVKVTAGGQAGRKVSLKKFTVYDVSDLAAVMAWAQADAECVEAIKTIALKRARAGEDVPGVLKKIEERAA